MADVTETITTSRTGGSKGVKLARHDLIPCEALTALAEHYGKGAEKYGDQNWRKGYEWSKAYAALQRHANAWWGGEDIDPETQSSHLMAVAFHAFSLYTWWLSCEKKQFDDRVKPTPVMTGLAGFLPEGSFIVVDENSETIAWEDYPPPKQRPTIYDYRRDLLA